MFAESEEVGGPEAKMERFGVLNIEGWSNRMGMVGSDSGTTPVPGDRRFGRWEKMVPAAFESATAGEGEFLVDEVMGKAHVGS